MRGVRSVAVIFFSTLIAAWGAAAQGVVESPKVLSVIDCAPNQITVYPGSKIVSTDELKQTDSAVDKLLANISNNRTSCRLLVVVRPGSVKIYRQIRERIGRSSIDAHCEPVDADFVVRLSGNAVTGLTVPRPMLKPPLPTAPPSHGGPVKPVVRAVVSSKSPVYYECRDNEVFFVDKEGLQAQVDKLLSTVGPGARGSNMEQFLKAIQTHEVGNEYYAVDLSFLMVSMMALLPRPGIHGEKPTDLDKVGGAFRTALAQPDARSRFVVFLLRDDGFAVFHRARAIVEGMGLEATWELLGRDEPIKFGIQEATIR